MNNTDHSEHKDHDCCHDAKPAPASAGPGTIYTCPMHPEIRSEHPGICPECGMKLVPGGKPSRHGQEGHDKHAGHSTNMFRDRFWLSLILTVPVVLYSHMIQEWFGFSIPEFPGSRLIPFFFGTAIFLYGGMVFLQSAYRELRGRSPGMMTLIALAITAAYVYSFATTFFLAGGEFFWELATLITIMLLGHWLEMRSVGLAQGALKELAKLLPDKAELLDGRMVPVAELKEMDLILIRPGSKIPADGVVEEGESEVNESMLTGESAPVAKKINDKVIGGTVNGTGSLKVKVSKVGDKTALAGIMKLILEAQNSRSNTQILADRAAYWLTLIAIGVGFATFVVWSILGEMGFALERTVTVLIIACPHALGLAVPLVTAISTTLGAKNGLLVRQRMALEAARNIDVVLFDKTGTLTKGEHGVVDIWPLSGSADELLRQAAAAEATSEHVLGRAVHEAARQRGFHIPPASNFSSLPGKGVRAEVEGKTITVGGPNLLQEKGSDLPPDMRQKIDSAGEEGKTVIFVTINDRLAGAITLADMIREESWAAIGQLKEMGVRVAMLTGDSFAVAKYVSKELNIEEFFAEVLPESKIDKVKQLQKDGSRVAMVGDGVNDAPALTQADVGIAIGAGTDVAIESAGIVLVRSNPLDVPKIIRLSRATYSKMVQNLFWATGYNALAIPLAAGVLAPWNIFLAPALGAALMSLSTVVVAVNAVLLRRKKI